VELRDVHIAIELACELHIEARIGRVFLRADRFPPCRELSAQIGCAVGLRGGKISALAWIAPEIEKLRAPVLIVLDQLPIATPDRARGPAALIGIMREVPAEIALL